MSKRSAAHLADWLGTRWSYSNVATNATPTADLTSGNIQPLGGRDEVHMDYLSMVILNKNTLSFTMTASVRDSSIAGTVLYQAAMLLPGSTTTHVNPSGIHLKAIDGKSLFFTLDTVQPSVTTSINAGGWVDNSTDY